jgi:hypothetical protein
MVPCNIVTIATNVEKVSKLQMKQKHRPTQNQRIAIDNIKRLNALAGKLQWESGGDDKSLDDAIDYLFDRKEKLEAIEKKDKKE